MVGRDDRVLPAMIDRHAGADPRLRDIGRRGEQAVETRHALQVRAGAGEVEHAEAAEAEADRRHLRPVHLRLPPRHLQEMRHPRLQQRPVVTERAHQREALLPGRRAIASAIEIAAKGGVAERHQPRRILVVDMVEAEEIGEEQHAGSRLAAGHGGDEALQLEAVMRGQSRSLFHHDSGSQKGGKLKKAMIASTASAATVLSLGSAIALRPLTTA